MLKGETISTGAPTTCPECGVTPKLEVLHSAAGYFIGTQCKCGPYSRESLYLATRETAVELFRRGDWPRRTVERA